MYKSMMITATCTCTHIREQYEVATVLLNAGADPNSKSHSEQTPLILAAFKGNMKVLAVLLRCPSIKLSEQVSKEMPTYNKISCT